MTYLELINNFWREFDEEAMSSNDALLYFFLLDYCNKNRWKNPFLLSNKNLMLMLELSEKTIIGARDRLSKKGLINYEGGERNCKAPIYFIVGADYNNFNCKISSRMADEWQKNGRRMAALFKDYKNKDKRKSKEKTECQEEEKKDISPTYESAPVFKPPTLEEVRSYFQRLRAHERIANWEVEAEKFFYHFDALGWRNGLGILIVRWQSQASKWIINCEQDEHKQRTVTNQRGNVSKGVQSKLPPTPGYGLIEPDDDC